jgi:hypothetical protein
MGLSRQLGLGATPTNFFGTFVFFGGSPLFPVFPFLVSCLPDNSSPIRAPSSSYMYSPPSSLPFVSFVVFVSSGQASNKKARLEAGFYRMQGST